MRHEMQLSLEQITCIHEKTVKLLEIAGIDFRHNAACTLLSKKGFKVDGTKVFISERQLIEAINSTPGNFNLRSMTSDKKVSIGKNNFILTSTSGPSFVINAEGYRREATTGDYINFLKLNHTSDVLSVMSPLIVLPTDIPSEMIHIDLMINALTMTDKPCLSVAIDPKGARESLRILSYCCGSKKKFESEYYTIFNINVLSPLGFAPDEIESLMLIAQANQPMTITNMAMSGATAPIRTEDAIIMGNAEILAGLVLIQAIQPGLPVIYGSTSTSMDMKSMISTLGSPETLQIQRTMIGLANHYDLVCRSGGSLTDAHLPDGRAMSESCLTLENAICHGAHFIMHACGMISSYMGASFEKWIMDEENCRVLINSLTPLDFESTDLETIVSMGSRGGYLTHPDTVQLCRSLYRSPWKEAMSHEKWFHSGARTFTQESEEIVKERLASYKRPAFGESLEIELRKLWP